MPVIPVNPSSWTSHVPPKWVPYHGSHSKLAYIFWSLYRMARPATIAVAALVGLLLAGCAGGGFGQTGVSLPTNGGDGVQTVSDAADALDVHRMSATENAKAAIA